MKQEKYASSVPNFALSRIRNIKVNDSGGWNLNHLCVMSISSVQNAAKSCNLTITLVSFILADFKMTVKTCDRETDQSTTVFV